MKVRVASAGTGKTTSLVLRYLELIAAGIPMRRIAGVTYTRMAASELRQRVGEAVRELLDSGQYLGRVRLKEDQADRFEEALRELSGATLTTIHGFMIEALRLSAPTIGLDPDFAVIGEWEAQALFEEEAATLLYLAGNPAHPLYAAASGLGSRARPALLSLFRERSQVERFLADRDERSAFLVELFESAYSAFERRLGARRLAPGEVERRALRLVRVAAAMSRVSERYRVVLVDEFQDVNPLQGRFFEALEASGPAVEVVGDPKQSIYGFRNADVGVFRRALAQGEELPPLDQSYRHAQLVNRFLNHLTRTLAAKDLGFSSREAPEVSGAGKRAEVRGRIEVHWVVDDGRLAALRETEARVLARRLEALHLDQGVPYGQMAVLARSHAGLVQVESALSAAGVPAVLVQGRGYYERIEIRDLYNALRAAVEPAGVPFAAWLRGPFARLSPDDLEVILAAADPLAALAECSPKVALSYRRLREMILRPPLEALKLLIREPLAAGRSFVSVLSRRQRENVDALLFTLAQQPPADLERLLRRLELLERQSDAGEVPQAGDGVQLLTVHSAKGLEWRAAAVFDLGGGRAPRRHDVIVHPQTGVVSLPGGPSYAETGRQLADREESESYRLLYVAASRPREILLLTGSAPRGNAKGWARALQLMNMGPRAKQRSRSDFVLASHSTGSAASGTPPDKVAAQRDVAVQGDVAVQSEVAALCEVAAQGDVAERSVPEWIDRSFPAHPYPPVFSPSRLHISEGDGDGDAGGGDGNGEPVRPGALGEAADQGQPGDTPGRATTVGTLVHYAISQSWRADEGGHMANLRAQEVMFPFSEVEQDEILAEVAELLDGYWAMLGCELPDLCDREHDEPELPMALPGGATVWQGVIDRLYRSRGCWYLDDYKTDHQIVPERYLGQLAIYAETVRRVRGVTPIVRLVYLRCRRLVALQPEELDRAYRAALSGGVRDLPGLE